MTLTLSAIFTAPSLYLHIEGEKKRGRARRRRARSAFDAADPLAYWPARRSCRSLYWSP